MMSLYFVGDEHYAHTSQLCNVYENANQPGSLRSTWAITLPLLSSLRQKRLNFSKISFGLTTLLQDGSDRRVSIFYRES